MADANVWLDKDDVYFVSCTRCGEYEVTFEASTLFERGGALASRAHLISGHCREAKIRGTSRPRLTTESLPTVFGTAPSDGLASADRFLDLLGVLSPSVGTAVPLSFEDDFPIAYCRSPEECQLLVFALRDDGFIKWQTNETVVVMLKGWERIREVRRRSSAISRLGFVAMSFSPDLAQAFDEGIRPAIEVDAQAGYKALRIDREEHVDRIDERILVEIRRSRFVVADFTGHRPGVYFEAGFALGLGLPVIWTCHKDHLHEAHFDVRQYNQIDWESPGELRERLAARIRFVVA